MKTIKIGLAGLGVVGKGVYDILQKDANLIDSRTNAKLELIAVSSRSKKDFVDETKVKFYENAVDLALNPEIDVIVEVIGGDKIAKDLIVTAIKNGKKVVTANKALIAENASELLELVEKNNGYIAFEASVAGATPIIKTFREGLAANEIKEFYAILNGTCNFILTKMQNEALDFAAALKQAQDLGYAEADPTFDIKGIDTAHKLAILSSIASATKPAFKDIHIEGVDQVTIDDIILADELGYKIKLLAIYKKLTDGSSQTVYPALVERSEKISQVDGSFNAILTSASNAGYNFIVGSGAGSLPTASAIVADLIDIANERKSAIFAVKNNELKESKISKIEDREGQYFIKLIVDKEELHKVDLSQTIFGDKIAIAKSMFLEGKEGSGEIICGFITVIQNEKEINEVLSKMNPSLVKFAKFLRVENTGF